MKKNNKRFLAFGSIILTEIGMSFIKAPLSLTLRVVIAIILVGGLYYALEFALKLWRGKPESERPG